MEYGSVEAFFDADLNHIAEYAGQQVIARRDAELARAHAVLARSWFRQRSRLRSQSPRQRARSSHGRRPGHRRVRSSTRAGPGDDGPGEPPPAAAPRLALAPKPRTIYTFAVLTRDARGEGS